MLRSILRVPRSAVAATSSWSRAFSSAASSGAIGVIGLGNMGGHMAANLLKHKQRVVVFDVSPTALERAKSAGAEVAQSPKALAEQCDTVITMLPTPKHVLEVYTAADGVFAGMSGKQDVCLIDSSTIDPETARSVGTSAEDLNMRFVDAPVSGGVNGAAAGTLTFMVGGDDAAVARATPVLDMMGASVVHCGGVGTGQVAKLANNLVLGITMCGVAEGMNLGVRLGMKPEVLAGIFNSSTAQCWSSEKYNPVPGVMEGVPASRDYEGGFGVDLMRKDLFLALDASEDVNAMCPLGEGAAQIYQSISDRYKFGDKDFSSVYKVLSNLEELDEAIGEQTADEDDWSVDEDMSGDEFEGELYDELSEDESKGKKA